MSNDARDYLARIETSFRCPDCDKRVLVFVYFDTKEPRIALDPGQRLDFPDLGQKLAFKIYVRTQSHAECPSITSRAEVAVERCRVVVEKTCEAYLDLSRKGLRAFAQFRKGELN